MKAKLIIFNMRLEVEGDKNNHWINRTTGIIQFINETSPLIIGVQEITPKMKEDLMSRLPHYGYIGLSRALNEEAVPILYDHRKLGLVYNETFWLSKTPSVSGSKDFASLCVRVATLGEFRFKDNHSKRFRVFNVHLDHGLESTRLNQIKVVMDKVYYLTKKDNIPLFIMGDFNATPNSKTVQYMNSNETIVNVYDLFNVNPGLTYHGFTGNTYGDPIDYIYVNSLVNVKGLNIHHDKYRDIYLSDHYPVSIEVEF